MESNLIRCVRSGLAFCVLTVSMFSQSLVSAEEILYNGIRLSQPWPPRAEVAAESQTPLPVPYLAARPAVVPIDVGRQLFVDDFLIQKCTLRRAFHHAEKYAGNPVLKPEAPCELAGGLSGWEVAATACPFDDGVFYDPHEQQFKLWYMGGMCRNTCLATSADGLHWTRPTLDVEPGTNVVIAWRKEFARDAFSPWLDATAADPAQRFKAFLYARILDPPDPKRHAASYLYASPDGIHWQRPAQVRDTVGDNTTIFYNPFRKKWVMSVRRGVSGRGRARMYFETDNFLDLANRKARDEVFWYGTDADDRPDAQIQRRPQLYCLNPIAYESLMLGAFGIHYGPENGVCDQGQFPKLVEIELGYSRDGFHFSRPDRSSFIAATRRVGDADRGYLRPAGSVCTVVGDRLYFYYCGFSGQSPGGQKHFYAGGSTHVAFLRRDGFASMDADARGGELTTVPLVFHGTYAFVNVAAAQGALRCALLDADGKPIPPFTLDRCLPIQADGTHQRLTWNGADDLAALAGKPVRFHFQLAGGKLYAFWVSPERTGASHGYVAAGGPGFTEPTDTTGP